MFLKKTRNIFAPVTNVFWCCKRETFASVTMFPRGGGLKVELFLYSWSRDFDSTLTFIQRVCADPNISA